MESDTSSSLSSPRSDTPACVGESQEGNLPRDCLESCSASPIESPPRSSSSLSGRDLLAQMKKELECSLCCQLFCCPTTTPCGHTFCQACLERVLDYTSNCPVCRHSIPELIAARKKCKNVVIDSLVKQFFPDQYDAALKERFADMQDLSRNIRQRERASVPIFVCTVVLPGAQCPLHVFEPRYKLMMRRSIQSGSRTFGMCGYNGSGGYFDYGTLLDIRDHNVLPNGRLLVDTIGCRRFKVLSRSMTDGYNTAEVEWIVDSRPSGVLEEKTQHMLSVGYSNASAWIRSLPHNVRNRLYNQLGELPSQSVDLNEGNGPLWIWWVARVLVGDDATQVRLLQSESVAERLVFLHCHADMMLPRLLHGIPDPVNFCRE